MTNSFSALFSDTEATILSAAFTEALIVMDSISFSCFYNCYEGDLIPEAFEVFHFDNFELMISSHLQHPPISLLPLSFASKESSINKLSIQSTSKSKLALCKIETSISGETIHFLALLVSDGIFFCANDSTNKLLEKHIPIGLDADSTADFT